MALLPTTAIFGPDPAGAEPDRAAWLFSSDLPFFALAIVGWRAARREPWLLALAAVAAVALAFHPSLRGGFVVARLVALAVLVVLARTQGRLVTIALLATTAVQVAIALAQRAAGGAVGLDLLGEIDAPYETIGGVLAPQGTTAHPYVFATLGLVTAAWVVRERTSWAGPALALALVPVGLSVSRAAMLGALALLAVAGAMRVGWRTVAAGAVGLLLAVVLQWEGWAGRAEQVVGAKTEAELTTDRGGLMRDATELIGRFPLTGVGPGLYVAALHEHGAPGRPAKPVHDVPLLVTAELGLAGGALLLIWVLRHARRQALPALLAVAPIFLLDHLLWWFPQGVLLLGLWVASLSGTAPVTTTTKAPAPASSR